MSRSVCYTATSQDAGRRIDVVLADQSIYRSRSAASRAINEGRVLVKGNPVAKRYCVFEGDPIVCVLDEDTPSLPVAGEPIDLDIRYEDDDLLVLSKQAGLVCHPTDDIRTGTLVSALIYHCGVNNLCNVQGENDRLGIVHRLDADTSGLMLAAKSDYAGQALMDEIRLRNVDRRYVALVHGVISPDSGMIDAPIARNPHDRKTMTVIDSDSARDAITTFKVLQRFEPSGRDEGYTLVECKLYTGRTHQIRVHMRYIKHPIVGDPVYFANGPRDSVAQLGLDRQFLHSHRIEFSHPITGDTLSFQDFLPNDLQVALSRIVDREGVLTEYGAEVLQNIEEAKRNFKV